MLLVTGTSGVGKTFTIEAATCYVPSLLRLSGSALLRSLGRPVSDLTLESAEENQTALLACLAAMAATDHAVFDGHAILETEDGLWPIQPSTVRQMGVTGIALIEDVAPLLAQRRAVKGRSSIIGDVSRLQAREQQHSHFLSLMLNIPYATILSGDGEALAKFYTRLRIQGT